MRNKTPFFKSKGDVYFIGSHGRIVLNERPRLLETFFAVLVVNVSMAFVGQDVVRLLHSLKLTLRRSQQSFVVGSRVTAHTTQAHTQKK